MIISVEPCNPEWKNQFIAEQENLANLLKETNCVIEHIGSTAIVNCAAKPIVDILIGLQFENDFENVIAILTQHQYVYFKLYDVLMPNRRFFVKYKNQISLNFFNNVDERNLYLNEIAVVHLHVTIYNNNFWKQHIAFRNYLQQHDEDRIKYSNLKLELSKQDWIDGNEYNAAKNELIKEI
jgi:GrpB-like predicted nucleotidyltransferase (UPF0157 family)